MAAAKKKGKRAGGDDFDARMAAIAKSGSIDECVQRMKSIAKIEDDPRLADTILDWLYTARWPGSGAADGWRAMFKRLVKLNDRRAIAPLRDLAQHNPPFLGVKHTAWIIEEAARTAAQIQVVPARPGRELPAITPKRVGPAPSTLAIVQRVFDSPDDDDLRRVVADELLENGDPWGELIQLQFLIAENKATPEQKKLAEKLISKHASIFGGPIAKIAKAETRIFEKGFLRFVRTDASMVPRRDWDAVVVCPHWSTVHRVEIDMTSTPKWFVPAWTKNPANRRLREFAVTRYAAPQIEAVRDSADAPWRVVEVKSPALPWLLPFRDFVARAHVEVGPVEYRDELLAVLRG